VVHDGARRGDTQGEQGMHAAGVDGVPQGSRPFLSIWQPCNSQLQPQLLPYQACAPCVSPSAARAPARPRSPAKQQNCAAAERGAARRGSNHTSAQALARAGLRQEQVDYWEVNQVGCLGPVLLVHLRPLGSGRARRGVTIVP
jgi:hypothetical protein